MEDPKKKDENIEGSQDENKDTNQQANADADVKTDDGTAKVDTNADDGAAKSTGDGDDKDKPGIIETIKNIIRRKPDDGTGDGDSGSDTGSGSDGADTDDTVPGAEKDRSIPSSFTNAAIKAGMTAEQVTDFASDYTDEQLIEQIPFLIASTSGTSDKSEQLPGKEGDTNNQQQLKKADGDTGSTEPDEKDAKIEELTKRIVSVEESQRKNNERNADDEFLRKASRATQVMDELSKDFEIFGTFETLPRFPHNGQIIPNSPEAKARNEVWVLAYDLSEKAGVEFEEALTISLNAFKGKHLEKDVQRKVVKDLKKSEKRLSPKHSSHEANKSGLSGPDVIRQVAAQHGVEIR